jgi:hypothetical protein
MDTSMIICCLTLTSPNRALPILIDYRFGEGVYFEKGFALL